MKLMDWSVIAGLGGCCGVATTVIANHTGNVAYGLFASVGLAVLCGVSYALYLIAKQ
jgi:hypothetical protein